MENNIEVRTKSGPSGFSGLTTGTATSDTNGYAFSTAFACHSGTNPFKDQLGEFSKDLLENLVSQFGDELNDARLSGGSEPSGNDHEFSLSTGYSKPVSAMALDPFAYNEPTVGGQAPAGNSYCQLDQFQKDVKAKASQILDKNKALIDNIQKKYNDSDSPAWNFLNKAMAKDQELSLAEHEAHEKIRVQEQYYKMALNNPYYATNNHSDYINNIKQRKAELDAAEKNYENIKLARKILRSSYPEILAVGVCNQEVKNAFSKKIDLNASNEEIGQAMASGFEKIKDDIDESIDKINNDDVPLETLSYVLDEVRKDPKYSGLQDKINNWIETEQSKDKWIKLGTTGVATVAGLGSLALGGWPAAILAGIGIGAGAGGAIYNLERSVDLFDVSQSQRVGDQLSETSYEKAKSDLVMHGVDLVLSGLDAAAVVKSWKGLSNVTNASTLGKKGEEAVHLAQAEKSTVKAVNQLKYTEAEAKTAKEAETLEKSGKKEYDIIKEADGPKTTAGPYIPKGPMAGKRIGHTYTKHGSHNTEQLLKQAKGSGMPQGQWIDDAAAEKFIAKRLNQIKNGAKTFELPPGMGRVVNPDGTFSQATNVRLVPSKTGVKTAFPMID